MTAAAFQTASASRDAFLGHWALTVDSGRSGWLGVEKHDGWYDASVLWIGGSVLPAASVVVEDDVITVTRLRTVKRKDASGKVVRTHQLPEVFTGRLDADGVLHLTRRAAREDGMGFDTAAATGVRTPPLPPRPDLSKVRFGDPITLFNGRDLTGWRPISDETKNGWRAENGVLVNTPTKHRPGEPRVRWANLRTEAEFEDFNLTLEVNVPKGGNSGVYLRGIYEVQVFDSYGRDVDSHNMGAIYSRITPTVSAEKQAGEWQTLDITLVDRHATVVLNGKTIIDNQPVEGCTGGALWSDVERPGPIYLQGDHGPIEYRNIVLRPVVAR